MNTDETRFCPTCQESIPKPSPHNWKSDYAYFIAGLCPKCRSQLVHTLPHYEKPPASYSNQAVERGIKEEGKMEDGTLLPMRDDTNKEVMKISLDLEGQKLPSISRHLLYRIIKSLEGTKYKVTEINYEERNVKFVEVVESIPWQERAIMNIIFVDTHGWAGGPSWPEKVIVVTWEKAVCAIVGFVLLVLFLHYAPWPFFPY